MNVTKESYNNQFKQWYRERAIIIDDRLHIICIANLWVDTSFYSGSIVDVFAIWSGRRRYVFMPTAVRSSELEEWSLKRRVGSEA